MAAAMPDDLKIELSRSELREVARYAATCAQTVLFIFERDCPDDGRPRRAIEAAFTFAHGAERTKSTRDAAWAAQRAAHAARDAGLPAASEAARAALAAAGAPFLHPLAKASQVRHILGAAAHAARAFELAAPVDEGERMAHSQSLRSAAPSSLAEILRRYPVAPPGGGRVGDLIRAFDSWFRGPNRVEGT